MFISSLLIGATRKAGLALASAIFLWQVAENSGPRRGEVVIHVTEPGVEIRIDDDEYPIEANPTIPLCTTIRSGRHTLTMLRDGQTVSTEEFTLEPGGHIVLTAWDKAHRQPRSGANLSAR